MNNKETLNTRATCITVAARLSGKTLNQLSADEHTDFWRLRMAGYLIILHGRITSTNTEESHQQTKHYEPKEINNTRII